MGLLINPTPKSFVSTACRDIASDNSGKVLTTEQLLQGVEEVHSLFKKRGYYDVIKNSSLYTKGNDSND